MSIDDPLSLQTENNVKYWKELQSDGYFENHPCYNGIKAAGGQECIDAVEQFIPFRTDMEIVVIGCGYGRESLKLAPLVRSIYGIDVSDEILSKAMRFLQEHRITNFTPVTYEDYKHKIPNGVDLVFSIVVMQHLTRNLVVEYFTNLGAKLKPGGSIIVQFLEELVDGVEVCDAPLKKLEPSVSWTLRQIARLSDESKLEFVQTRTIRVAPKALWHWVHFRRGAPVDPQSVAP